MQKRRVLVTGATGYIVSQYLDALRTHYDVRLLDIKTTNRDGQEVEGVEIVDLVSLELDDLLPYFEGIDTVVHSAYLRAPRGENPREVYPVERGNIDLMYKVLQLSLEAGVRRVVSMSTNHAASWYEQPWRAGLKDRVSPDDYPKPARLYGWAKTAYESLGFVYAAGNYGRKLENIQIRIVAPRPILAERYSPDNLQGFKRDLAGYISPLDLTQLVQKSIDAPDISDEYGVPFQIFYGVSNNARKFWSITNARKVIGYEPVDDSELKFRSEIEKLLIP